MLRHPFHRPLRLHVTNRELRFDSESDFEFALASRTEIPAARVAELMPLDTAALMAEASRVRGVERHFVDMLAQSIKGPGSIGLLLRQTDMKLFSHDHDWRAIMQALARQPRRLDAYKQLAVVKYMQYLASRQDVLAGLHSHKRSAGESVPDDVERGTGHPLRETVIFADLDPCDLRAPGPGDAAAGPMERLPRGEAITLRLAADEFRTLVLSRHPFRLRLGEAPALVTGGGNENMLQPGRNLVGRHPDCDVTVDPSFRDVSRTHVIIDVDSTSSAQLVDLSSHGTFLAVPSGDTGTVQRTKVGAARP